MVGNSTALQIQLLQTYPQSKFWNGLESNIPVALAKTIWLLHILGSIQTVLFCSGATSRATGDKHCLTNIDDPIGTIPVDTGPVETDMVVTNSVETSMAVTNPIDSHTIQYIEVVFGQSV